MKPAQLIYFNDKPWYGVSLIARLLGNSGKLTPVKLALPERESPVIMFSFLAAREFQRLFYGFDRCQLPYYSRSRGSSYPLVIAGGGAMMNPEPIADFVDIICIGEGELWAETIRDLLEKGRDRDYIFGALAELPGAYIPARRSIEYDPGGIAVRSITGDTRRIAPAVTKVLPIFSGGINGVGSQHDLELARSCKSKCTFCSIGWSMEYREQPIEKIKEILTEEKPPRLWASNMGGVSYLNEIYSVIKTSAVGEDIRIDDFLRWPYPEPGEYQKKRYTFGLEGINERLRAILGKSISDSDVEKMIERVTVGQVQKCQFYYIRGTPTESADDWRRFREWIDFVLSGFEPAKIAVEFMLTPLTRTPHTPLQWIAHRYSFDAEAETMNLLDYARKKKRSNPDSILYITPSRRAPAWLLDTAFQCGSRRLGKFLYAVHSGKIGKLDADSFDGRGYDLVRRILNASGTDPDALLDSWDTEAVLPWSFIMPFGERGDRARVAAYRRICKLIEAYNTGGVYDPATRSVKYE